jgi:hypothetical protein
MNEPPELPQCNETKPPVSARYEDQDRTLRALQQVERASAAPLHTDHGNWQRKVVDALSSLEQAMAEEQTNADQPYSLLSNLAQTQPRLRSRVRGTRVHYQQVRKTVSALRRDLTATAPPDVDLDDARRRVSRLASALRYQRARESDLIYEAYYDTFDADIESETNSR